MALERVAAIRFQNRRIRRQYLINLGGLALVLLCLFGGLVLKSHWDVQREAQQQVFSQGQALKADLDGVLAMGTRNVRQLSSAAQDMAARFQTHQSAEIHDALEKTRTHGALSEAWPSEQRDQVGSVFYRTDTGRANSGNVGVALELNRLMGWAHRHNPMFVWSYSYLADKDVTGLYPYLDRQALLKMHRVDNMNQVMARIFDAGTRPLELVGPSQNPQAQEVWTPVYNDQAGKGLMVSLLKPVYVRNSFWGVVGTDLLLEEIKTLVNTNPLKTMRVEVVNAEGVVMASNRPDWRWSNKPELTTVLRVMGGQLGRFVEIEQAPWLMFSVQGPDWKILLSPMPGQDLYLQAPLYLQMLAVLALVLLIVLFIGGWFHVYLARPVMHLVSYIDVLEHHPDADFPSVPRTWQGWFKNLQQRALERRSMLDELRHAHDYLEEQVAQRTESLQAEIREREALQISLVEARQAADTANQAKSRFLADMSHEIRTPLNAVIGLAHLALQGQLNAHERNLVEKILQSGEALLALLDDILDLSKIEAGKLVLSQQPIDPACLARQVWGMFEINRRGNHVALALDVPTEPTVWVQGDLLRLRQVLTNLMGNALKFTENGTVSLQVSAQATGSNPMRWRLRFAVQDSGIGMSDEQQMRLFNAFEQASSDTWQQYKGTGLGLAISALLVKAMGGELQVRSAPGQGSTFWFEIELPSSPPPAAAPVPAASGQGTLHGVKILLVEDHALNRMVCEGMLKVHGCVVVSVHNGQEAVDWCSTHGLDSVDLILMDVHMPVMGGFEATRQLRAMGCQLPILALTANAFTEDREASLNAGMNDHLTKPFDPHKLASVLKGWVGRR